MFSNTPVIMGIRSIAPRQMSAFSAVIIGIACYGATVAVSALSYRWFESPFLRLKARLSTVRAPALEPT